MAKICDIELIQIPTIEDLRGNLAFVQNDILPFELKRVYYLSPTLPPFTKWENSYSSVPPYV
jgi:hypothetical protein